jgi:tRNA(Arg) A34 adenosine deaminase TadA
VSPAELAKHEKFMRLAIAQANRNPGRPFGSVLVDDRTGQVVAKAWRTWPPVRCCIPK